VPITADAGTLLRVERLVQHDFCFQITPDPLPMIVVGYSCVPGGHDIRDPIEEFPALASVELPLPSCAFMHQHGGLACLQVGLIGIAFSLERNRSLLAAGADSFVAALRSIVDHWPASQPRVQGRSPAFALISDWWNTFGESMDAAALAAWDELLARYMRLPPLTRGFEAFLETQPLRPSDFFAGWIPVRFVRLDPGGHTTEDGPPYEPHFDTALESLGAILGRNDPPRAHIVWENSD